MEIAVQAALMGAVVGALIGGGLSYLITSAQVRTAHQNAIELIRINSKKLAGLRLREAFAPELSRLQTQESFILPESSDMLERTFQKHQMAVNEFRLFLDGSELDAFTKIWEDYYKDPTGGNKPYFTQYMALSEEDIQKAIDRIEAIMKFTENK